MKLRHLATALLLGSALTTAAHAQTKLLRDPAVSDNAIAFAYAGDIWVAERDGSNAKRLTSHAANERDPIFSPDGSMVAFTANYDGNDDVFVVSANGGEAKRLTWHPGTDTAVDWAPGGGAVAITSPRERGNGRSAHLYHVSLDGGLPQKVSEARIANGTYDESGRIFASVPGWMGYNGLVGGTAGWRGYRGGATPSLQLIDFEGGTAQTIPGDRTTEFNPVWVGGQLYFLSDRDDKVLNIFRFTPTDGSITKISNEAQWDIRAFDAHGDTIVYEAGGEIKQLSLSSGAVNTLPIDLRADLPQRQPSWKSVEDQVTSAQLSPSGKRVAITARGEVFTVPTDKGSTRNISNSASVRDYTAVWSNDGTKLAYITDNGTTQSLIIEDQSGIEDERAIALGDKFYQLVDWGGDGKHLIYASNKLKLHALDIESGQSWEVTDSDRRNDDFEAVLSPRGRWLAYTTRGANTVASLHLYDLSTRQSYPVTGDYAEIGFPMFSKDGKLLYFAASTNAGAIYAGLDMTTQDRPFRSGLYAVVLEADGESPLAPVLANEDGNEEKSDNTEDKDNGNSEGTVNVNPNGLIARTVSLPVAEASYTSLASGKDGALYYIDNPQPGAATGPGAGETMASLMRFDFKEREATSLGDGFTEVSTNASGDELLLVNHDGSFSTADAGEKLEAKPVSLAGLRMRIDPAQEWRQIFNDVWRMEKEYFYDPNMHGLDWEAVRVRYEPLLAHVGRREDLNELLVEMIGEMQVGHNRVGGGELYDNSSASPGLLGADIAIASGRYRISKIYDGEQWNPFLAAPLAAPGVDANEGDYIIAVNGQELTEADNIYAVLSGAAGTQVSLTVASTPNGTRRTSVIEPVGSENGLRLWDWIEANRKRVEQASDGKVAYVYMPNTAGAGYTFFNRMYFAQTDKQALILDERSNGGGQAANYIIDVLSRKWLSGWKDREGLDWSTPGGGIWGPKVMLIDQDAGSGGDWMPYAFREAGIGTLIGTRTWGGLIGISTNPGLIDGGFLTVPFFRFFDRSGRWSIENEGTVPDIRVELDPIALEQGRDTQLEAAISTVMQQLEDNPPPARPAPAYPMELGQ
ncbi:S41 family peptidase [uncultured Erythrobacter sp.]|uniref:S41 family peptidase n=1 Tax=uncultured Erythrobacter sp. TaxID=263913 RepID=UPI002639E84A|nr:S41 family peptidase [uncultured Erythrobacter sp.]